MLFVAEAFAHPSKLFGQVGHDPAELLVDERRCLCDEVAQNTLNGARVVRAPDTV
eukprot:CAMPEP_0185454982 /NCGR_PEP_ID=MMETSP1365-20130426/74145_1 /TAXON_ID=38817 /ORGANISM="Gephyrocapsa oceanica, Strain RCC1303" /LENGTH=54 /DNA_ID=CAMNT_0028061335 /DNA_START=166 /DNA_END=326 /DNA_ORIENTATION=-